MMRSAAAAAHSDSAATKLPGRSGATCQEQDIRLGGVGIRKHEVEGRKWLVETRHKPLTANAADGSSHQSLPFGANRHAVIFLF